MCMSGGGCWRRDLRMGTHRVTENTLMGRRPTRQDGSYTRGSIIVVQNMQLRALSHKRTDLGTFSSRRSLQLASFFSSSLLRSLDLRRRGPDYSSGGTGDSGAISKAPSAQRRGPARPPRRPARAGSRRPPASATTTAPVSHRHVTARGATPRPERSPSEERRAGPAARSGSRLPSERRDREIEVM